MTQNDKGSEREQALANEWEKVMSAKKSGYDEGRLVGFREAKEMAARLCADALRTNDHHACCTPAKIRALEPK